MKAVVYTHYGPPDVLQLKEVAQPTPKDNEVLVKVVAASANAADWHLLRAKPFLARLEAGLFKPKYTILGGDIAGRVEAVGSRVTQFRPGDEVFGDVSACGWGGFAEYVVVPENAIVLKPATVSFEQAAAVPLAAITALQGLRNSGKIQAGQKVLVNGASGGVGTFGVQIAKSFGAEVTGVCSTPKIDMVRSIGAEHVVDYTREDFTQNGRKYDLIFDAVGNRSVSDYRRALKPQGVCVIAGFTAMSRLIEYFVVGAWVSRKGWRKVGMMPTARPNQQDLRFLQGLLEAGKIVPVIDRCYPLSETAKAIAYLEEGHARGKVIITVVN